MDLALGCTDCKEGLESNKDILAYYYRDGIEENRCDPHYDALRLHGCCWHVWSPYDHFSGMVTAGYSPVRWCLLCGRLQSQGP